MSCILLPDEPDVPQRPMGLLTTRYVVNSLNTILENQRRFDALLRVAALRRSCGIEPSGVSVSVRIPKQYAKEE